MNNKLYVGNIPFSFRDQDLAEVFNKLAGFVSAKVIMDNRSGRSKGYGFVEFDSEDNAQAAVGAVNGSESSGRTLKVAISVPREDSGDRDRGGRRPNRNFGGRGGSNDFRRY
ncbi:MAG TPA: RNA-binding protein [Oligoflexia bacterium]|nr:RNA-binding protein [Oligoflexia bacterium]HMP27186.1 RNA-binding protein [Oligoflexia bacterium]